MKKIFCLLLALALLLCGCASRPLTPESSAAPTDTAAPTVSMYDLRTAMLAADPSLPEMMSVSSSDENAGELFSYLSTLDYEKVDSYFLSYAADGKAYEIAVVALRDAADLSALVETLNAHVQGRVDLYKTYAPEQVQQAEAAEIVSMGRYVALIMCDERAAVKAAFAAGIQ